MRDGGGLIGRSMMEHIHVHRGTPRITDSFISGANPYLTFHCANQGTVLIDLAPDDKEFQSVEEEVCGARFLLYYCVV